MSRLDDISTEIHDDPDDEAETTRPDADWPVPREYAVEPGASAQETLLASPGPDPPTATHPPTPGVSDHRRDGRSAAYLLGALGALILALAVAARLAFEDESATSATRAGETRSVATPPARRQESSAKVTSQTSSGVVVPEVQGMSLVDGRAALERVGLRVRVRRSVSRAPRGEVLGQTPSADASLPPRGTVTLRVSRGPELVTVPSVVGETADDASRLLRLRGFRTRVLLVHSAKPAGKVLSQSPAAGRAVHRDSTVRLSVAKARRVVDVAVPRLVGLEVTEARIRLGERGLRSTVSRRASRESPGTVLEQDPGAGARVRRGATVRLVVSSGPARVSVPDVVGLDEATARQQLEDAGFVVEVVGQPTTDPLADGQVVEQSPVGGQLADDGSVVTLTVARLG